jgi:regulator of telomere elongation helicase 1
MCPYFYTRESLSDCDVVLLPYNYLIDPNIRSRLGLNFDNSIVIFDEAHNLESVCSDSASFDLTAQDIAACILEVQKCIDLIRDPNSSALDQLMGKMGINIDIQELAMLKALLLQFEQILEKQPLPDNGEGYTRAGSFIFELMNECRVKKK